MAKDEDTLLEFPCDFPIKIIGRMQDDISQITVDILNKHFPALDQQAIITRPSKDQTYIAITATVTATSKPQLDDAYLELSAHPKIMMVL